MPNTKLLLHICCAPCATGVLQKLKSDGGFDITGYYYNPNIHPSKENEARKKSVEVLSKDENIRVLYDGQLMVTYWKENLDVDKERRCKFCYTIRIDHIAKTAKEKGFDAFTTTLLVSPWQDHEKIQEIAETVAKIWCRIHLSGFQAFLQEGKMKPTEEATIYRSTADIFSYRESDHKKKPVYTSWY